MPSLLYSPFFLSDANRAPREWERVGDWKGGGGLGHRYFLALLSVRQGQARAIIHSANANSVCVPFRKAPAKRQTDRKAGTQRDGSQADAMTRRAGSPPCRKGTIYDKLREVTMKISNNKAVALACFGMLAAGPSAFAITISHPVAASPATAGNGLTGRYYGQVSNSNLIFTTGCAMDYISENKPVATFKASEINYPGPGHDTAWDSVTLGAFLGKDAATLSKKSVADNHLEGQLFDFKGYLNVKTAGKYKFSLGSDDGSRLLIGGQTIVDNQTMQSFTTRSEYVTFTDAGLYPLEVAYFENWGVTGIRLSSDMNTVMAPIAPGSFYSAAQPAPTDVPEPGSIALLIGAGTVGCGLIRRKK